MREVRVIQGAGQNQVSSANEMDTSATHKSTESGSLTTVLEEYDPPLVNLNHKLDGTLIATIKFVEDRFDENEKSMKKLIDSMYLALRVQLDQLDSFVYQLAGMVFRSDTTGSAKADNGKGNAKVGAKGGAKGDANDDDGKRGAAVNHNSKGGATQHPSCAESFNQWWVCGEGKGWHAVCDKCYAEGHHEGYWTGHAKGHDRGWRKGRERLGESEDSADSSEQRRGPNRFLRGPRKSLSGSPLLP